MEHCKDTHSLMQMAPHLHERPSGAPKSLSASSEIKILKCFFRYNLAEIQLQTCALSRPSRGWCGGVDEGPRGHGGHQG